MILTSAPQHAILTYSSHDNRFGQLGSRAAPLCTMHQVEFFDGLRAVDIAAGVSIRCVQCVFGLISFFDCAGHALRCSDG